VCGENQNMVNWTEILKT